MSSTIKSNVDNLILNADGTNRDVIFQSNGVEMARFDGYEGGLVDSLGVPYRYTENAILNGKFELAQRATSQIIAGIKSLDRWRADMAVSSMTMTQKAFSHGQTDVPGNPKNYLELDVVTGGTTGYAMLAQKCEDIRKFAGKKVQLEFWVRTPTAGSFTGGLTDKVKTTTVYQGKMNAGFPIDNTWRLHKIGCSTWGFADGLDAITNEEDTYWEPRFWFDAGSASSADTTAKTVGNQTLKVEIAGIRAYVTDEHYDMRVRERSPAEELHLCHRYYQRWSNPADCYAIRYSASTSGPERSAGFIPLYTPMRGGAPTLSLVTAATSILNCTYDQLISKHEGLIIWVTTTSNSYRYQGAVIDADAEF